MTETACRTYILHSMSCCFCTPLVAACGTYGKVLDTIDKDERSLSPYVRESIEEQINDNISKYDN